MELKTVGLTKEFGSKIAVDDLNITLANGVYGLLGANGAGKTTLMRLLCNIQNPTSGKILLNGKNAVGLGERYRSLLGYLPQHFGYYPDFSAFDFLLYVSALKGLDEKAARKKSKELLEAVDLSKESKHKIKTFSGGMKQRLGIAQAMLNDPRILILDEPTAGLDPKERVRFRNLISAFSKDRIVILSTHIVSDVEFIAEEIIMMKSGQIIHFGNPQEITSEINGQVWECTVPTAYAEKYAASYNTSNLRNTTDTPYLTVRRAWHTESNRPVILDELKTKAAERNIPLPICLADCLREAKANSTSEYVVPNRDGDPLSYTQFKRLWQYIVTRTTKERVYYRYEDGKRVQHTVTPVLGEKAAHNGKVVYSLDFEVTPHQLRHTYITNLIHSSVDPKTVQYLAGHESSKITMDIYAKVKYNRPDELVKSMGGAFAQWDGVRS